jgi:hypothetical protein
VSTCPHVLCGRSRSQNDWWRTLVPRVTQIDSKADAAPQAAPVTLQTLFEDNYACADV